MTEPTTAPLIQKTSFRPSVRKMVPSLDVETGLFWGLVLAYLLPIWLFRYFPTQDGPVHLGSSVILKNLVVAEIHYEQYFDIRWEIFPNWTAHFLLAGLMFIVPALVAEKLLVSAYVIGLAGGLRYFCGSFGPSTRSCALIGLLLIYNRCLWMGFYNFVLSLALCFLVLGYWLRRRAQADFVTCAVLTLLLVLEFFTHLVGFAVTIVGLAWFALTSPQRRWANLGWVMLASVPAVLLTWEYLDRTRFLGTDASSGIWGDFAQWLNGQGSWRRFTQTLADLNGHFFSHHVLAALPMAAMVAVLFIIMAVGTMLNRFLDGGNNKDSPRWPCLALAASFFAVYVCMRDGYGVHGSVMKPRLALLPPLFALGWFTMPTQPIVRFLLQTTVVCFLVVNLALVGDRIESDNQELAEYVEGKEALGTGHTLEVFQQMTQPVRNGVRSVAHPMWNASEYYCLDGGNVRLGNYQARTNYFPIKYRGGNAPERSFISRVDVLKEDAAILIWERSSAAVPRDFTSVFKNKKLEIFTRARK